VPIDVGAIGVATPAAAGAQLASNSAAQIEDRRRTIGP
jgi:hypothetical protein